MPYNVLAASPEQTFAQAVQQAQTTEADGFETAAPAEENLVTADAESTEKVTYTVTPGVSYGKGSIKLISGVTESTGDDGEKVYTAEKDSTITFEAVPEDGWALDSVMYMSSSFTTPDLKITKVDGKENQYTCTIPDDAYAYGSVGTFMIYVQFAPVLDGHLAIALANDSATAACYKAADEAMSGYTNVGRCVYFRTPIEGLTGTQIGGHIFY